MDAAEVDSSHEDSSQSDSSPGPPAGGLSSRAQKPPLTARGLGLVIAVISIYSLAYRELWTFGADYELEAEIEHFFFIPNDNAPMVVLVLAAWLAFRRWPELRVLTRQSPVGGMRAAVVGYLGLGLGWTLWARYATAPDLQLFSLVFNGLGVTALVWGRPGLRVLWLPIVFMLFCIPIPGPTLLPLVWKMQLVTAEYADWLLFLVGKTAFVSGDQIIRPLQTFQVIEGCSGLRSVQTLTMLTVVLVDLFGRRGFHAALLIFLAPGLAFFLNGFRVLTLILNPHSELLAVHMLQGILILLAGLTLIYALDGQLERFLPQRTRARPEPAQARGPSPVQIPLAIGLGLVTLGVSLSGPVWQAPPPGPRVLLKSVRAALADLPETEIVKDYSFSSSARFDQRAHMAVSLRGVPVEVFVGTENQRLRLGSPFSPTLGFPSSGWAPRETGRRTLEPGSADAQRRLIKKQERRVVVYHWYHGSQGILRESLRSLLALHRTPFRREETAYVVRLATIVRDRPRETSTQSIAQSDRRLQQIYERIEPTLSAL